MKHFIETKDFEHNKEYIVCVYVDGYWYPKTVKIWKDTEVVFRDIKDESKRYWIYNLYMTQKGVDENGTKIYEITTFDSLEEAHKFACFENAIME